MSGGQATVRRPDAFELAFWEPGDRDTAAQLLDASTQVDGRPNLGVEWFEWKMAGSPWGPAVVAYARDRETGDIAGEVAFGAWRFWHQGADVPAALSYETYVVPAYQRRGLFSRLTVAAIEELRRRGVELIVNFPNANSLPGFLKLGFEDLGGFQTWIRPRGLVRTARFAYRTLRGDRVPRVPTAAAITVSEEWIDAAGALAPLARAFAAPWTSARDAALLRWRYASIPTYHYATALRPRIALLGRVERIAGLRTCRLLETIGASTPSRREMRDALADLADVSNADVMLVQLTSAHPLRRWLPTLGFLPAPDHISVCARHLAGDASLVSGKHWAMTPGDFHTT